MTTQMNKINFLIICFSFLLGFNTIAQQNQGPHEDDIVELIAMYAKARVTNDTVLLRVILTEDIDQLVSSGEWRDGLQEAIQGMKSSSDANPGSRTLSVEKVKFLSPHVAIADARYLIRGGEEGERKMWSAFVVVYRDNRWKISSIRNMLPTK